MARIKQAALATTALKPPPADTEILSAEDIRALPEVISFDEAVREAKTILVQISEFEARGHYRIGALADKLEPKYGDRTLAKFAKEIGIAKCTVDRYRTVYRAWKGKLAPGPILPSYAVLRELATHPEREQIIRDNPNLTKSEAQQKMRDLKGAKEQQKQKKQENEKQENDWLKDNRRWFRELCTHAAEARRRANVALECTPEKLRDLLQVIDMEMVMSLGGAGVRLRELADLLESLLEEEASKRAMRAEAKAPKVVEPVHPEISARVMA
jgi:hypothetical protein